MHTASPGAVPDTLSLACRDGIKSGRHVGGERYSAPHASRVWGNSPETVEVSTAADTQGDLGRSKIAAKRVAVALELRPPKRVRVLAN